MPKRAVWVGVAATTCMIMAAALIVGRPHHDKHQPEYLRISGKQVMLEVAATKAQQEQGLGDRKSLPSNRGMLFRYDAPQKLCFWMKDMRFPLDIIWLDQTKRVSHIEADVAPQTYPRSYCVDNARYVIELNAGQSKESNVKAGARLDFN